MISKQTLDFIYDSLVKSTTSSTQTLGVKEKVKQAMLEVGAELLACTEVEAIEAEKATAAAFGKKWYRCQYSNDLKINTIKVLRDVFGYGLKEAKDLSESGNYSLAEGWCYFHLELTKDEADKFQKAGTGIFLLKCENEEKDQDKLVKREFFLVIQKESKTVKLFADHPEGLFQKYSVLIKVSIDIPMSVFEPQVMRLKVNVPPNHALTHEMKADLQQAVEMQYGKAVQVVVEGVVQTPLDQFETMPLMNDHQALEELLDGMQKMSEEK